MDNYNLLQQASDFAESGDMDRARSLVMQAINNDKHDVEAWWALAHVANSDSERKFAVDQVLKLDPDHMHANLMRDQIKAGSIGHIQSVGKVGYSQPKINQMFVPQQTVDYMSKSIMTLIAYFLFPIGGLALNIIFMYEARQFRLSNGYTAKNAGCLSWMFGLFIIVPLTFLCIFILLMIVS